MVRCKGMKPYSALELANNEQNNYIPGKFNQNGREKSKKNSGKKAKNSEKQKAKKNSKKKEEFRKKQIKINK